MLFNDTLNTFHLRLYGVGCLVDALIDVINKCVGR